MQSYSSWIKLATYETMEIITCHLTFLTRRRRTPTNPFHPSAAQKHCVYPGHFFISRPLFCVPHCYILKQHHTAAARIPPERGLENASSRQRVTNSDASTLSVSLSPPLRYLMLLLLSLSHTPPRAVSRTLAAPRAGCCGASRTLFSHVECGGIQAVFKFVV